MIIWNIFLGNTPLHEACSWGNQSVVEVLISNKASINGKDNDGKFIIFLHTHTGS